MKRRVTRHDLSYLVTVLLLVSATVTASTGLISELLDLNEFIYHKYAAYTLIFTGIAHVFLHWGRLVGYVRWRLGRRARKWQASPQLAETRLKQKVVTPVNEEVEGKTTRGTNTSGRAFSRREFLSFALGGLGGLVFGNLLRDEPNLPYGEDMGVYYHEWSKPTRVDFLGTVSDWGDRPDQYKVYPSGTRISLPPPGNFRGLYTEEAIKLRRSIREYSSNDMTLAELSRLLYYTGGITTTRWGSPLRAAPSAGALYPIEIYLVIHRVESLEPGLYHYAVKPHRLELIQAGDLRGEIVSAGFSQEFLGTANVVMVFTSIFQRLRFKYRDRTYRYALMEVGHLGQNAYLAATSMDMGACVVGAFHDDELNNLLGVDGRDEAAISILSVGKV